MTVFNGVPGPTKVIKSFSSFGNMSEIPLSF
jgi:hypothetical protein